MYALTFTN